MSADHLLNHRREGFDLLIGVQRHGTDAAGLVAGRAFLLDDRRDGARIGNAREGRGARALGKGDGFAHRSTWAAISTVSPAIRPSIALPAPAANRAAIGDVPVAGIDEDDLGGLGDAQRLADQLLVVEQDRHIETGGLGVRDHLLAPLAQAGVDHHEFDPLAGVGALQRGIGRSVRVHRLVADGVGDQHHRLVVAQPVQLPGLQVLVGQHEVVDDLGGARPRAFRVGPGRALQHSPGHSARPAPPSCRRQAGARELLWKSSSVCSPYPWMARESSFAPAPPASSRAPLDSKSLCQAAVMIHSRS